MSEHMKEHHINNNKSKQLLFVLDHDVLYAIPKSIAKKYIIKPIKPTSGTGNVSADDIFKEMDQKYSEAGALLRGLRARENLSQVEFAKKIEVSQANLSKMENGTRPIGKIIAKRIAAKFSVDYKYFL